MNRPQESHADLGLIDDDRTPVLRSRTNEPHAVRTEGTASLAQAKASPARTE